MKTAADVGDLVQEYRDLSLKGTVQSPVDLLVNDHEWTQQAAEHLLRLAEQYGSFMLRNAFALSLALGIEDGELDF